MTVRGAKLKRKLKNNLLGFGLISPMVAGFVIFSLIPLIQTIRGSFYAMEDFFWEFDQDNFIGFGNYQTLFQDPVFIKAITNTLFLMLGIPIGMIIAFFLATLINSKYVKAKKPYLVIYYLPAVSSAIAIGIVWKWLFNAEYGLINNIFHTHIQWLSSPEMVKITLVMKGVWGGVGGTLLLYYASIQNISLDMYEAAEIAGANAFHKTFRITIPLVSGTTFYILVTGVIGGILAFADNYVVAAGTEAQTIVYYLYLEMKKGNYGLVTAGSILVFVALFLVTLLQFYLRFRGRKKAR